MTNFDRRGRVLYVDQVPLTDIATEVGTPCYVYSRGMIEDNWRAMSNAFANYPHLVCYSVKANSNLAVLNVLSRLGSGFDIVSGGELERVLRAGGDPAKVVFSGVGKTQREIEHALEVGIRCIDVESGAELKRVNAVAARIGVQAPVAVRVNPDIDADTHPYIATGLIETKFGIPLEDAIAVYRSALQMSHISIVGVAAHIGVLRAGTELRPLASVGDVLVAHTMSLVLRSGRWEAPCLGHGEGGADLMPSAAKLKAKGDVAG